MKAKEFIPATKPRNFVAKNQKTGGAGAHRDKKKEQKQGYEKHKGKGVAEGEKKPHPKTWHDVDPKLGKAVDKMSQAEKVKKGLAHPDTLKKKGVAEGISVVDQDYDLDQMHLTLDIEGKRASFTYTDYDENFDNAERRDVFDQLQNNSWYKGLDHPTKMEILDAAYKAIRGEEPSEYKPRVDDEPLDMDEEQEMEGRRDYGYDSFGNSLRPGDDEGNTEPPNNFAVYINGKKWKVFQGRGTYADDFKEKQHFQQLKAWAHKKSMDTGKKWEVYITGESPTA